MSYKSSQLNEQGQRYEFPKNSAILAKNWLFWENILTLGMYIIWNTNRKVHILFKMSYNSSQLMDQGPSYGFPKNSASFAKMAV